MQAQQTGSTMECPDPEAKIACHSFQELLVAKDADLLYNLKSTMGQRFVCFRPKEDVFFVLRGTEPDDEPWEKQQPNSVVVVQSGAVELVRFKNGVFDHGGESAFGRGEWRRADKTKANAVFVSQSIASEGGAGGEIEVDGGTVTISHPLDKTLGMGVHYSFKLQISTGRFVELFTAPNIPDKEVAGRCLRWNFTNDQ